VGCSLGDGLGGYEGADDGLYALAWKKRSVFRWCCEILLASVSDLATTAPGGRGMLEEFGVVVKDDSHALMRQENTRGYIAFIRDADNTSKPFSLPN
jgi:hypothetical protein